MKLDGLDYLNLSSLLDENECIVQQSTREFVDKEIIPIIDGHFDSLALTFLGKMAMEV